ncbi:MAG: hypothetical protein RO009_09385 [Pseudorhodoplanes sp.]|jgi:hypothetical protein|nr:hypothetical protein [Pseudorhodoplanes sp.]
MIEWVHVDRGDILFAADGAIWRDLARSRRRKSAAATLSRGGARAGGFSGRTFQLVGPSAAALRWNV